MIVEHFAVKHYTEEEGPIIKGNGFDGLRVGDDRQDAEELTSWINTRLDRLAALEAALRDTLELDTTMGHDPRVIAARKLLATVDGGAES